MFNLSNRSLDRLTGVHPDLCAVVRRAIEVSEINFIVTEGLRSKDRQESLVAEGKSETMNSRHLTGHAVDLAIWEDRDEDKVVDADEISWKFPHYLKLAEAMKKASGEIGIRVVWGAAWDDALCDVIDVGQAHVRYVARKKSAGEKPFIDAPHFELDRKVYPT